MKDIEVHAHLSNRLKVNASVGTVKEIPVGPDLYGGSYTVTAPSTDDLVLPTKNKLMEENVVVKANHEIEDELLDGSLEGVYYNDRITELRPSAFFYNKNVRVINLPNVQSLVNSAQALSQTNAEEIYLPRISGQCWNSALAYNPNLRVLDYGKQNITNIIRENPNLEILILRNDKSVMNPTTLSTLGCKLSPNGSGGYVYVPQAILEAYRASELWQTNAHVLEFRPIEGSEYELEEL